MDHLAKSDLIESYALPRIPAAAAPSLGELALASVCSWVPATASRLEVKVAMAGIAVLVIAMVTVVAVLLIGGIRAVF